MTQHKSSRRNFIKKTAFATTALAAAPSLAQCSNSTLGKETLVVAVEKEWRNQQNGMSYRQLGRTGFMVSEMVLGTFPFKTPDHLPVMEAALEMGINYFDTAAAYGKGTSETAVGDIIKTPSKRDKLFISTKISGYHNYINGVVKEIVNGLPQGKQNDLRKKAEQLILERTVKRPGYHINYFGSQESQFDISYLKHVVLQEYGYKSEWKKAIKKKAFDLFHESLERLNTDYVDVLHCPHGIANPDDMDDEIIQEVMAELKQQGKIRSAAASFHNDVTGNLTKAIEVGYYDVVMFAYNIANHAALENAMYKAKKAGIGMVAMKVGKLFSMRNQPEWRLEKLDKAIPDQNLSAFARSYLWALQNPNLSCCVSQMETIDKMKDNCQVVGKKIEINAV